jgi:2,3-diketo-5-methylthio-1-phosphopentane phosphatase
MAKLDDWKGGKMIIFCDFDGTITMEDVIDRFLEVFASEEYIKIEQLWQEGRIGSRECLSRQIKTVRRINELELRRFLDSIKIDPYFREFYRFVKLQGWKLCIVSDGFDLFIRHILKSHGIVPDKIICSELKLNHRGDLIPSFPYYRKDCDSKNATCKCYAVFSELEQENDLDSVYIGDGRSDLCVASKMERVFAKDKLFDCLVDTEVKLHRFADFGDVLQILTSEEVVIDVKRRRNSQA